jgi:hypothetical protein
MSPLFLRLVIKFTGVDGFKSKEQLSRPFPRVLNRSAITFQPVSNDQIQQMTNDFKTTLPSSFGLRLMIHSPKT